MSPFHLLKAAVDTLDLTSQDAVLCGQIFVPQQKFRVYGSSDVSKHACPKHFGLPPNLQPRESEIVDAVFQSEKPFEVSLWKAASYAISTRLSFLTIRAAAGNQKRACSKDAPKGQRRLLLTEPSHVKFRST